MKRPNSEYRNAIPEGFFASGKSKQVYDVLYGLTRGAINPTRTVRISRAKLMKLAGVGSRVTIDNILAKFTANGLLKITFKYGEHAGNEIEVFIYEEISDRFNSESDSSAARLPSATSPSSGTSSTHNLGTLDEAESRTPSVGPSSVNTGISAGPKTLFKDFKDIDDERAVTAGLEKLAAAVREVTGREITRSDWKAFDDLMTLFIDETVRAASRTSTVSAFVKFGVENLRRRLSRSSDPAEKTRRRSTEVESPSLMSDEAAHQYASEYAQILAWESARQGREAVAGEEPLWEAVLGTIESRTNKHVFQNWFSRLGLFKVDHVRSTIVLEADEVSRDWIERNYADTVRAAFKGTVVDGYAIEWEIRPEFDSTSFRERFTPEEWMKIDLFRSAA